MKAQAFLEQHADFSPTVPGPSTAVALFTKTHDHPNHAGVRAWPVGKVNIRKVDLQLQSKLAARLSTLQKACTAAQFNADPAGSQAASIIAIATVHTPVLHACRRHLSDLPRHCPFPNGIALSGTGMLPPALTAQNGGLVEERGGGRWLL